MWPTIIISVVLAALVALAVRHVVKKGACSCGDCSGSCAGCGVRGSDE